MKSTTATQLITDIKSLLSDSVVSGIAINNFYESTTHTVTPPAGSLSERGNDHFKGIFDLPDGRKAVTIDTWGSQANRYEQGIKSVADDLGYPLISVLLNGSVHSTSLDWSHRQADAQYRLIRSALEGTSVDTKAVQYATVANAEALLRNFPASVLYGWWDSHTMAEKTPKAGKNVAAEVIEATKGWGANGAHRRSSRAVTSEIIAKGVKPRQRFAARLTSYGAVNKDYSSLGLGTIPPQAGPIDVTYAEIHGKTFVSFPIFRRFGFGENTEDGRALAVVLSLVGIVTANKDLHLRTGAELTLEESTASIKRNDSSPDETIELPTLEILIEAARTLGTSFGWGDDAAVTIDATKEYLAVINDAASHTADGGE